VPWSAESVATESDSDRVLAFRPQLRLKDAVEQGGDGHDEEMEQDHVVGEVRLLRAGCMYCGFRAPGWSKRVVVLLRHGKFGMPKFRLSC